MRREGKSIERSTEVGGKPGLTTNLESERVYAMHALTPQEMGSEVFRPNRQREMKR